MTSELEESCGFSSSLMGFILNAMAECQIQICQFTSMDDVRLAEAGGPFKRMPLRFIWWGLFLW